MCIAGSRRGSGESCYQELAATDVQHQQQVQLQLQQQQLQLQQESRRHSSSSSTTSQYRKSSLVVVDSGIRTEEKIVPSVKNTIQGRERRSAEITVNSEDQNAVFVRISAEYSDAAAAAAVPLVTDTMTTGGQVTEGEEEEKRRKESLLKSSGKCSLSEVDRILLESLEVDQYRSRHTGRFLTMHKRRRKRLVTRSLNQEPGILDDIFHGLVQCVLQKAGHWRFNAFTLETVTGGRSLPVLCVHLFHWYGLLDYFNLDVVTVWKLFAFIEEGYHSTNPYHNSVHATDVTQAMHCFLQEEKIRMHLTNLEVMASLIAAVTHDLDHPGVNQPFLVATSNHLAALYQNTSVLENHHWRSAIGCLLESGVSQQLPAEVRPELQRHISSLILATDITRQQEFLTRFKNYLDENTLDMKRPEDRHFILQIALKCADISNPCRPWDISRKWSYKVCEEFFRQGDYERRLNLPVTPLCDRHTTSIPKIQAGFFKFVVTPLYEEWHRFLGDGLSVSLMEHLRSNQKKWEALIAQENAEDTETEISELEEIDAVSSCDDPNIDDDSGSIDLLIPGACTQSARRPSLPGRAILPRVGRRHSVPLSITKPVPLLSKNQPRRESLPNEHAKSKNPLVKLEDQNLLIEPSSLSLLSSRSSIAETSTNATERPVSAENLLPEPSIASITNSTEASRLSSVLQADQHPPRPGGTQTKQLTRQQTFPPLQPYARMRYMSTTTELSQCYTQVLVEANSISSSSSSPTKDKSCSGGRCGTPPSLTAVTDVQSPDPSKTADMKRPPPSPKSPKEYLTVDNSAIISNKRRDFGKQQKLESVLGVDHPRRHSMQMVAARNQEELGESKQLRQNRPSSAQESPDTTEIFYTSLTGSHSNKSFSESADSHEIDSISAESSNKPSTGSIRSTAEDPRGIVLASSRKSEQIKILNQSTKIKYCVDSEMRRFSTPTESNRTVLSDSAGRRFTAIPVTSELNTHKFFIGSPPDSPPRNQSISSSSDSGSEPRKGSADSSNDGSAPATSKRDSDSVREKSFKIAKLSMDVQMKENVDPKMVEESSKGHNLSRRNSQNFQGCARRRGSAPVALLSRLDDLTVTSVTSRVDHNSRRGSVPTDITEHHDNLAKGSFNRLALGPREENLPAPRRSSLPQEAALGNVIVNMFSLTSERENFPLNNNNNNNNNTTESSNNNGAPGMPSPRRGSVPADISELRRDLFGRNSVNGKTRNRKKILKRRSSGGPEMFAGGIAESGSDTTTLLKWKKDFGKRESIGEPPVVKRRGSLPIEVVAASHTGSTASGVRRSSLWRL